MRPPIARLLLIIICCYAVSCKQGKPAVSAPKQTTRAFYYWKSVFRLSAYERAMLDSLHIRDIYVKLFDVEWNTARQQAQPVAPVIFTDTSYRHYQLHPVIFITNECLQRLDSTGTVALAGNISTYCKQLLNGYDFTTPPAALQIDCDWTAGTKDRYFQLLKTLQQDSSVAVRPESATIRLYQLKYADKTGIPPVPSGMLMCYNMGNLKSAATGNSIIETAELEKYIQSLAGYPLPCDVAFPLFDWYVWYRNGQYKGLLYPHQLPALPLVNSRYTVERDTVINGLTLAGGDMLRYENSDITTVLRCAEMVNRQLKNTRPRVILYHLDSVILTKFRQHELEQIFNGIY